MADSKPTNYHDKLPNGIGPGDRNSFSMYINSKNRFARWERGAEIEYWQIKLRWPQLANWRFMIGQVDRLDAEKFMRFNKLVIIGRDLQPNERIKAGDAIDLIREFAVGKWPKPEELKKALHWHNLTSHQKQKVKELLYWMECNDKPRNPRHHSPISTAYDSVFKNRSKL